MAVWHGGSFGDDDEGAVVALGVALIDKFSDFLKGEGDFWEEDDVSSTGDAAPESDPAGVATHHFEDHHALVTFSGGVEAVEGIDNGADGAVEAEGEGGGAEVIIDGFWHANDGPAFPVELEAGGERAVAADDDESGDAEFVHGFFGLGDDFGRDFGDVSLADFGSEMAFIGGAEDGAAEFEDADGVLGLEYGEIAGWQETLEAVAEADDFPAELVGGTDDAMDDGIESGAVAAAVEDSNFHR